MSDQTDISGASANSKNSDDTREIDTGFKSIELPLLKRKNGDVNEYHIYSNDEEFEVVHAETVVIALEKTQVQSPVKIFHANCRFEEVISKESLLTLVLL